MKFIIVHFHLRPGGIRRIIELAAPSLADRFNGEDGEVVLASGEAPDDKWLADFKGRMKGTPLRLFVDPSFLYLAEQTRTGGELTLDLRRALQNLLGDCDPRRTVIWAHNLGIGRNLLLARELVRFARRRGIRLVSHHHDWWFENRWLRWPEMRRFGIRSLNEAAKIVFSHDPGIRHAAINHADAFRLGNQFGERAFWMPNLTEPMRPSAPDRLKEVRSWLSRRLNVGDAPIWILPCRLLRRKNVAEALLLTRWLRPEAWLVMTGGVSSADEQAYADHLLAAAKSHHWRMRLEILHGSEETKPSVSELLESSEAVLLTSIQEGFGLPFLEAAASRRPLIARSIPNIAPDLERFGFRFPQYYDEIYIDPRLFQWEEEARRQRGLYRAWKGKLPAVCRSWAGVPSLLNSNNGKPAPVPFSRLTLAAQVEVLSRPVKESWAACSPLNPFLRVWKERAAGQRLQVAEWPAKADAWLSGEAYAKRFEAILNSKPAPLNPAFDLEYSAQTDFMKAKLDESHLFPLLWSSTE